MLDELDVEDVDDELDVDDEELDDEDDLLRYQDDESRELLERYDEPELELELELDERYFSPPPARPCASRSVIAASLISIRKNNAAVIARIDREKFFMFCSSTEEDNAPRGHVK